MLAWLLQPNGSLPSRNRVLLKVTVQDQLRASASEVATAQSLDEFPLSSITIASEAVVDFPFIDDDGTAHPSHDPDATLIRPYGHQPKE